MTENIRHSLQNIIDDNKDVLFDLFENLPYAIIFMNETGDAVFSNHEAGRILGKSFSPNRPLNLWSHDLRLFNTKGKPMDYNDQPASISFKTGEAVNDAVIGIGPANASRPTAWLKVSSMPYFKENKKKPHLLCLMFSDITRAYEDELKLKESETKFRTLYENMMQGVLYYDVKGEIISANHAALEILGIPLEQLKKKTPMNPVWKSVKENGSIFSDGDHPAMQALLNGRKVKDVVMGVYNPHTKSNTWLSIDAVPLFDTSSKKPIGVFSTFTDITQQRESARALEVSMTRFKAIFNSTFQFMGLMEPDGIIIEANDTFLKFIQMEAPDVINKYLWDILDEMVSQEVISHMKQSFIRARNGEFIRHNIHLNHPSLGLTVIDFSLTPVFDPEGKNVIMLIPEGRDITQLRKQEEMARIFERAFMKSTLGVAIVDYQKPGMPLIRVNEAFEKITGYKASEILGKNMRFLQGKQTQQPGLTAIREALQTGSECRVEVVNYTKQGEKFWNELYLAPVNNRHGQVTHYVGMINNVTQKKIEQQELDQYRESLEQLVEIRTQELSLSQKKLLQTQQIAQLGSWEYDLQTSKMLLSEEFHKMLNSTYMNIHISFRTYLRILCEDDAILLLNKIRQIKNKEISYDSFELRHIDHFGNMHYLYHSIMYAVDDLGREMILGSVLDITAQKAIEEELKQAYQKAEQANKAKSIFLANMSHEIRTPLNAIIGFSDILLTSGMNDKQTSQLQSIRTSGKNLLRIINDILDLSKIEAGKMHIKKEPAKVENILGEIKTVFTEKANNKGIKFFIEQKNTIPHTLIIDVVRLHQVLINLVSNAVKFTHSGYVRLTVDNVNKTPSTIDLHLSVTDTGIGIPEDEQESIFKPFYQQKAQSESIYGGTGLGLTITKNMVNAMGGTIQVKSVPGEGSTFEIILSDVKISSQKEAGTNTYPDSYPAVEFGPATLLIADDNHENRKLLTDILSGKHTHIYHAENGEQALALAHRHNPDLILMDLRMPVMNGFEATKKIKNSQTIGNIPVIGVSASSQMLTNGEFDIRIFDDFLIKPLEVKKLTETVKKYIPYKVLKDEPAQKHANTLEMVYPVDRREEIAHLAEILEENYLPVYHEVAKKQLIDEIHDFGKALQNLASENDFIPLYDFSQIIINLASEFEIDDLIRTLHHFPEFIRKIKLMLQE